MKTHNAIIYHCVCCGNVVHREPAGAWPQCCGREMVKAAAETICNDSDEGAHENGPGATRPVPPTFVVKPR